MNEQTGLALTEQRNNGGTITLKFSLLGIPVAKQSFRQRIVKAPNGHVISLGYKQPKVKKTEDNLLVQVRSQLPKDWMPFDGKIIVESLEFCFPPLKSTSRAGLEAIQRFDVARRDSDLRLKTTKPDLDNLEKLLWDSMNGIVFLDDSQICVKKHVLKRYSTTPKIELIITGEYLPRKNK